MKSFLSVFLYSICMVQLTAQKLDLIVTVENDSIACTIDSISKEYLYFTGRWDMKKMSTRIPVSSVSDYRYGFIDREKTKSIPRTMYFRSSQVTYRKNTLYGTAGLFIMAGALGLSYERLLVAHPDRFVTSTWLKAQGGLFSFWEGKGPFWTVSVQALSGKQNHHLELGAGFGAIHYDQWQSLQLVPVMAAGYRYQKPNGGFLFRAGLSVPELLFISLGFSF
jgi:hypothetical protein